MLDAAIEALACPVCGAALARRDGALGCGAGHSFDIARQGYVNLLPGDARPGTADTAAMIEARAAFLAAGHFARVAQSVAAAATRLAQGVDGCVVDAGAGTGYYLAHVLDALPDRIGLALDISKHAARRAARAHERGSAVVCDTWGRLPLRDATAAVVLDIFSPRNAAEFERVLASGGGLVVVTPTEKHLSEIRAAMGLVSVDARKTQRVADAFAAGFEVQAEELVEYPMRLARDEAVELVAMGPSSRHATPEETRARASELADAVDVMVSVTVVSYRKNS